MTDRMKIIISRTDSIGDVVLTLPLAGLIKERFPQHQIFFLGSSYTKDIVKASSHIDTFLDWTAIASLNRKNRMNFLEKIKADVIIHVFPVPEIAWLAWKSGIPVRIGTTGRFYHFYTCNRLVAMSRKRSHLHEAQLNLKLAKPLGFSNPYSLFEIGNLYGIRISEKTDDSIGDWIAGDKFNLVLHPKSKGSAREWGIHNFSQLISILPKDKFRIFITGTHEEGELFIKDLMVRHPEVINLTGKFTLEEFIRFLNRVDGIVSASTGPLHIAAALGKYALGIYPPIKPMHPGRWAPLGHKADYIVSKADCSDCRNKNTCKCMESITPQEVYNKLIHQLQV